MLTSIAGTVVRYINYGLNYHNNGKFNNIAGFKKILICCWPAYMFLFAKMASGRATRHGFSTEDVKEEEVVTQ